MLEVLPPLTRMLPPLVRLVSNVDQVLRQQRLSGVAKWRQEEREVSDLSERSDVGVEAFDEIAGVAGCRGEIADLRPVLSCER